MDDATTREIARLNALHNDELRHTGELQAQKRYHTVQMQAQAREHRRMMLHIEHTAIHGAAIARQEALNNQKYKHRERMLQLERSDALARIALKSGEQVTGVGSALMERRLHMGTIKERTKRRTERAAEEARKQQEAVPDPRLALVEQKARSV